MLDKLVAKGGEVISIGKIADIYAHQGITQKVKASGNDGHVPGNVSDGSLGTRWSNLGKGSWIRLDLGSKQQLTGLKVAWYEGNKRKASYVISVSDDDATYTQVKTGTTSGTSTGGLPVTANTGPRLSRQIPSSRRQVSACASASCRNDRLR